MVSVHFSLKASKFLVMVQDVYPKTPPDRPLLCNWVFSYFILADEPFAKALQSLKTSVLVNNN